MSKFWINCTVLDHPVDMLDSWVFFTLGSTAFVWNICCIN